MIYILVLAYNILEVGGTMNHCDFGEILKTLRKNNSLTQKN